MSDPDINSSAVTWDSEWAARLKQARLLAGKSQNALATELNVSQPTVSNWEQGATGGPDEAQFAAIEKLLGRLVTEWSSPEAQSGTDLALWLRQSIEKKQVEENKTVAIMAAESGVSIPTLYNILNNNVAAPQVRTLRKLQDYFGEAPEEVNGEASAVRDVGQLGEFSEFDPYDETLWPNEPGVYILYDISDRPIYVGKSKVSVAGRLRDHQTRFWYKQPLVIRAEYVAVKDPKMVVDIETLLIKVLRSLAVINQRGVIRDPVNEE